MHKKWSLNLGSVSGIGIYIHWTFLILVAWIFLMHFRMGHGFSEGLSGMLFILALFGCVVLHEFGHALTAKRFGIRTTDITLYPIGGIANLESMPEKPGRELQVALAGPLVNVAIAVMLWIYLAGTGRSPSPGSLNHIRMTGESFVLNLMAANFVLAVFNLVPAFPMDGGRILRALLAMKFPHARATIIASRTGQILAIAFVFLGFFYNFWLVFIGLFVFLGAGAETRYEEMKDALRGVRALNVMMTDFTALHPDDTLRIASGYLLNTNEKSFVVTEEDKVVGILDYKQIVDGLHGGYANKKVASLMQTDFRSFGNEDYLEDRFPLIQQESQSLFPVMNGDKLSGIVTMDNIRKWIQAKPYAYKP